MTYHLSHHFHPPWLFLFADADSIQIYSNPLRICQLRYWLLPLTSSWSCGTMKPLLGFLRTLFSQVLVSSSSQLMAIASLEVSIIDKSFEKTTYHIKILSPLAYRLQITRWLSIRTLRSSSWTLQYPISANFPIYNEQPLRNTANTYKISSLEKLTTLQFKLALSLSTPPVCRSWPFSKSLYPTNYGEEWFLLVCM